MHDKEAVVESDPCDATVGECLRRVQGLAVTGLADSPDGGSANR